MKRRGFSLLEVVLAIGLVALLAGSVVGFIFELSERRAVLLAHSRRLVAADAMVEAIEGDVFTCLAGDGRRGAGVRGDAASLRVLSRTVQLGTGRTSQQMRADDLRSTEYRFDRASGAVTAARVSVLFAGEAPGGARETIIDGVKRVRFRYYDGQEWRNRFDSGEEGRLPAAIEIAVWFAPTIGTPEPVPPSVEEGGDALDEIGALDGIDAGADEAPLDDEAVETLENLPPPDRLRIVVVPDAGDDGAGASIGGGGM